MNPKDRVADPHLRIPIRWEPSEDEARVLPHAVLLAACTCGFDRTRCTIEIAGKFVEFDQLLPLNPAAREIFRRLAEWDKMNGRKS